VTYELGLRSTNSCQALNANFMKTQVPKSNHLISLIIFVLIIFVGCSDDAAPDDPEPEPNPVGTEVDVNKVVKALRFRNSTVISGTIATIVKTADLKIDTDTIFWVEGIKNRIKILKPAGQQISSTSFYAQVVDADSYIEAEFEIEDETDTVVFMNVDFDLTGLEPPFSFNIRLVPLDDSGTPIDEFELPVNIEEPIDGDCDFAYGDIWEWIYTVGSNDFFTAPMLSVNQSNTLVGCCSDTGNSYYEPSCLNPANNFRREVNYENVFMVEREFLKFFESGLVAGELRQYTQNINPSKTDFCGGVAGYNQRNVYNAVGGTITVNQSNCTLIINEYEGLTDNGFPLPFYAGAGPDVEYKVLSRHFLREKRNGGEGSLERMYERRTEFFEWFD
jgi:hypothetical protein